jgi:hypothetical protein
VRDSNPRHPACKEFAHRLVPLAAVCIGLQFQQLRTLRGNAHTSHSKPVPATVSATPFSRAHKRRLQSGLHLKGRTKMMQDWADFLEHTQRGLRCCRSRIELPRKFSQNRRVRTIFCRWSARYNSSAPFVRIADFRGCIGRSHKFVIPLLSNFATLRSIPRGCIPSPRVHTEL